MNHKWKDNVCVNCGVTRQRKYWKLRMAITNFPPYDHYMTGTNWWYGKEHEFKRPECKKVNHLTTK